MAFRREHLTPIIRDIILGMLTCAAFTAHVPGTLTYLLPDGFFSNYQSFLGHTSTSDPNIQAIFSTAADSVATCYTPFTAPFCETVLKPQLVADWPGSGAFFEGGIYIPRLHEVWFTSSYAKYPTPGYITAYNLSTSTFRHIPQIGYGAGGIYNPNDDKVYIGAIPPTPGVIAIDPETLSTTTIFNSYFGLEFSCADDLVWVTQPDPTDGERNNTTSRGGRSYMFFTHFYTPLEPDGPVVPINRPVQLPNGVWRWDPAEKTLRPVISRLDIPIPNGIRVSPDHRTLYITDSLSIEAGGSAHGSSGYAPTAGPNVYAYDLDDEMLPVNRRVFSIARSGYPDGIHIDDEGRVWTAEGEGIVVRSPRGTTLALFSQRAFGMEEGQIANFGLANDSLLVAAMDRLYVVRLGMVVAKGQT
ncbi:SMP-30/gluconolactonase/LRE family protein [Aspergillus alliaceus]|uniref:SMP-30/gluconolactonase/LRE family protein n=1 Tax=Petromyces alliaceus TaxID=209559 RepID=UPI0012A51E0B|nr:uncharacterized protein BDW43DRAFT_308433 [Aspergillus alliaceus]KAB8236166.1 hypothetical protein BDW43DRAFT_308433 [Aspergillus alliaceus]